MRAVVVGMLAYVALVLVLRVSGTRTRSTLNAGDRVVTVAFATPTGLQFAATGLSARTAAVARLVKAGPAPLAYGGRVLPVQLGRTRVMEDEVLAAVRGQGIAALGSVEAVVLETDGSFRWCSGRMNPRSPRGIPRPVAIGHGIPRLRPFRRWRGT